MKIKAIDIAKELGLSKATVSLALNNKPGVSEQTKQDVFECMERMQNGTKRTEESKTTGCGKLIKIVVVSKNLKIVRNSELDLWTDVNAVFDQMAKKEGYTLGISYPDLYKDSIEAVVMECNVESVAGVVLLGTELEPEDIRYFRGINKPMVIYDSDMQCNKYPYVVVNNRSGVKAAVDYLVKYGHRDIVYLANSIDIYNYLERRSGFEDALKSHNLILGEHSIVTVGDRIETVFQNMKKYLNIHKLPSAFVMESYHISVGAIRAFRERGIVIPDDISLIGIDELPSYMTGECQMTTIRIPHTERAVWVMMMLFKEIADPNDIKSRIFTNCKLIEGNSVRLS